MKNENRIAVLPVSTELLVQVLQLPAGTRILNARISFNAEATIEFKVEHQDFSPVEFGQLAPIITPQFAAVERFHWFKRLRTVKFLGWS